MKCVNQNKLAYDIVKSPIMKTMFFLYLIFMLKSSLPARKLNNVFVFTFIPRPSNLIHTCFYLPSANHCSSSPAWIALSTHTSKTSASVVLLIL